MDLPVLPPDSMQRVDEMCRLRRERTKAEQQVWLQESRLRAEEASFVLQLTSAVEDDEAVSRAQVQRLEAAAFAKFIENKRALHAAALSAVQSSRKQTGLLRRTVQRATFREFWRSRGTQHPAAHTEQCLSPEAAVRKDAVTVLRRAYLHSAPPFAADPEDLWRRGVTIAPDFQRPADELAAGLSLPPYHEFAFRLRSRYAQQRLHE